MLERYIDSLFAVLFWTSFALLTLRCGDSATSLDGGGGDEFFVFEVLPILQAKCFSCHGEDPSNIDGGLNLTSRVGLTKGGDQYRELVVPGRPEMSPLFKAVKRESSDFAMPPKEREALAPEEVQVIYNWIVSGAQWPNKDQIRTIAATSKRTSTRVQVKTSKGETKQWSKRFYRRAHLWAYKPLKRPSLPDSTIHPIDAFIDDALSKSNIRPAPQAEPRDLIKRLYFGVTGLPPSPDMVMDFDRERFTYFELIDQVLKSPHYGEAWANHWLDVVRYADSDGFSNDFARPNAWRYRDYVVRSFNADKPYDQFVREQISGDEMNPDDPDHLIATGFLRMGPWEHTGMSVAAETRQFYLDDVTNIIGETFLATPLSCAKCHDHKYDPIPTQDYYEIQSVFATTQFADRPADFLPGENLEHMAEERERIQRWLNRMAIEKDSIAHIEELAAKAWYQSRGLQYLPRKQRRRRVDTQNHPPRYIGLSFADLGYRKVLEKRSQIERRNLERFEPWAYSVYNGPDRLIHSNRKMRVPEIVDTAVPLSFVLKGGSVYAPGDTVSPGVLSVLHHDTLTEPSFHAARNITTAQSGRRLAFSQWLTHPENPLTARVMVNRIWQHHFGRGLAENPNNFGATGRLPTHPELLDWLAAEFIASGWSIKHMDRLILTSEAYRRATAHPKHKAILRVDPNNHLYSYYPPRRLEAEEIRDAILLSTGELQLELGGIPARPEIPLEVAMQPRHTMGSVAPAYQPSPTASMRNRRSIYMERKRAIGNPMMEVFDQNDNDISCEQREESTVVTQAFTMLNSQYVVNRSLVMAARLSGDGETTLPALIQQAHQEILLRKPTETEIERAVDFINQTIEVYDDREFASPAFPIQVEREMIEEMTGESFTFMEYLDVFENYESDLENIVMTPKLRSLADYIAVLFNSNEFLYVY